MKILGKCNIILFFYSAAVLDGGDVQEFASSTSVQVNVAAPSATATECQQPTTFVDLDACRSVQVNVAAPSTTATECQQPTTTIADLNVPKSLHCSFGKSCLFQTYGDCLPLFYGCTHALTAVMNNTFMYRCLIALTCTCIYVLAF